ncbi:MAG: hypothetical protein BGO99_13735 [Nitrosospira sp. 56-18]|nr:MAG: hypothetical protein BGO99_13735 [Nitrosospira sp. 56-18]
MSVILRKLEPGDIVTRFRLGHEDFKLLKKFLKKDAKKYHAENLTKTWVLVEENQSHPVVLGYISLICSHIDIDPSNGHAVPGYEYKAYPCVKIARLAIHQDHQKKGYGIALVEFSISITKEVIMDNIGCRFLVVDSKPKAIDFYKSRGFTLFETTEEKTETTSSLMFMDLTKIHLP